MADGPPLPLEKPLFWSARWSLTTRILAVNVVALALLAGGFFYLDSYRTRLVDARLASATRELGLLDIALRNASPERRDIVILRFAAATQGRLRVYAPDGTLQRDSFTLAPPTYSLRDPDSEPWQKHVARAMDRGIDWVVGAKRATPYAEPARDTAQAWPEIAAAAKLGAPQGWFRYAADRTPMISAGMVDPDTGERLLLTTNARDITRTVREERLRLSVVLIATMLASVLLSLFLARTIVKPLRLLARAAVRVRLGRAREVTVPRLPDRRDEIGTLARALSDMSQALRERIDAGEHFAADVTHELKNPLASLRSAIEGLGNVRDDGHRATLLKIAGEDVLRLDRLVTDISEASRMDAELSRTRFEPVDIGAMIESMLAARQTRAGADSALPALAFARPRKGTAMVMGDDNRLERAIGNLIDNAVSFATTGGVVRIAATRTGASIVIRVEDDGPGVPHNERDAIFRRFHSVRPVTEDFGKHSGLGLAIARTIVEGHQGEIAVLDREDGASGACFEIRLPAMGD